MERWGQSTAERRPQRSWPRWEQAAALPSPCKLPGWTECWRPLVVVFGGRSRLTEEAEDEVQLLLDRGAGEEGPPCGHLVEDAAHAPAGSNGQGRVSLGLFAPALASTAPPRRLPRGGSNMRSGGPG